MKDEQRYQLIAGPYKAPKVKIGAELTDALRGPVTVSRWSNGRIPWPLIKTPGRSAFILTGDLLKAVQQESSIAIQYWWGVSPSTVHRWRRSLSIDQYTEGTLRLHREWKPEKISAAAAKRGQRNGATPQARAKMTKTIRERGYYQFKQRVWTPEEEALLGTMPDPAVAQKIGRTLKAVGMWRRKLGIPAAYSNRSEDSRKNTIPIDAEKIAQRRLALNLSQKAVAQRAKLDPTHLSQLETGFWRNMRAATVQRLAKALKCEVRDLQPDPIAPVPDTTSAGTAAAKRKAKSSR